MLKDAATTCYHYWIVLLLLPPGAICFATVYAAARITIPYSTSCIPSNLAYPAYPRLSSPPGKTIACYSDSRVTDYRRRTGVLLLRWTLLTLLRELRVQFAWIRKASRLEHGH